jgi:curli biogenesis system outer membrane secretion channel CsgG
MKLAIALACLIASLSFASQTLAGTVATLQQPVAKPVQFVANGALWNCKDSTCVAGSVDDMYFGASECHTVAKHAGVAVSDFKTSTDRTLQTKDLDQCNAGLAPKTSVATAH